MNIEVKTNDWVLPNRVGYNKKIYDTFHPSKYYKKKSAAAAKGSCECTKDSCELDVSKVSLFPQQKIIKDYMQFDSPYRGILSYHGLGSGKSAASIAASEGYINRKNVIIMTPASLSQNYENELMKISTIGLNLKKSWTCLKVIKTNAKMMEQLKAYAIDKQMIKKEGTIWVPLYKKDIEDAEILIDNIKYTDMPSNHKEDIKKTITHIIRNRYKFINYNGITMKMIKEMGDNPFDNSFIIVDEVHNFISRIANGSKIAMKIYNFIVSAKDVKLVLLSGTPIINQPYEISFLINLLRGPMTTYKIPIIDGVADKNEIVNKLIKAQMYDYVDELYQDNKHLNIILLPINYVRKDNVSAAIVKKEWGKDEKAIIKEIIKVINKETTDEAGANIVKKRSANKSGTAGTAGTAGTGIDPSKPYLIVTNGTTGSLKTKMADEIIKHLKLNATNTKINIDDLVIKNKEYKKRVLDIIKKVAKECNNNKACISEKYENPDDKLLEDFGKAYYDVRKGEDGISCTTSFKNSCDKLNDLNLENALNESRNIVFESQGLSVPSWLLSQPYLTEKYNVIFGYSLAPVKKIADVIKKRAKARIDKYLKNPDEDAPRMPSVDRKTIGNNIKNIVATLKELRKNCINDAEYLKCGNKKIDKLLVYENNDDFKFNIVYDNKDNITEDEFERLIYDIVKMDAKGNFQDYGISLSAKYDIENNYALPSKKEEFAKLFINDEDVENIKVINEDLFKRRILGTLSYYKTSGSELFPSLLPETIRNMYMTDNQIKKYVEVRIKEIKIDDAKKKLGNKGNAEISSVYRAFSRLVCNFAFPDEIQREFPQEIRTLKKKEMALNEEDEANSKDSDDAANDKKKFDKDVDAEYNKKLMKALSDLRKGDYLEKKNLREKYSPKFAQMLDDIETSPGSVLVYSQFRVVEGLGIFKEVLNKHGYVEINIVKNDEYGYILEDPDVFDEKYDNKRYVTFNSDREKTNILMNLFNGDFANLPDTIKSSLPNNGEGLEQRYGKIVRVMMITQSGAEGISLKNVRRVLITEYFWNSVRIDQVIGRAVRTCSHMGLPVEDRNVGVYKYLMKFTKDQIIKNPTLKIKDSELTTDEHIYDKANKKEKLIMNFLDMLKSSSIDCVIHADVNKPLKNGYKCYNWPINIKDDKLAFTQNILNDSKITQYKNYERVKTDKGKVVSRDGIKYVLLHDKLYDYNSYKNAGVLLLA
jgi:hypothetical protein